MATRLIITLAIGLSASLLSTASLAEAYYWVDENGKRQYSDRVPPNETKHERKIIDERGYTVKTLPEQRTAAEIQATADAKAAAEEQAAEEKRKLEEAIAYDRLLTSNYQRVSDLERARDDRLGLLDASILVEMQAYTDNNQRLSKLRDQEQELLKNGKPVPKKLSKNINSTQSRINTNVRGMAELKKQRAQIEIKYNKDIKRYLELTSAAD